MSATAQAWTSDTYWDCKASADGTGWTCQQFERKNIKLKPVDPAATMEPTQVEQGPPVAPAEQADEQPAEEYPVGETIPPAKPVTPPAAADKAAPTPPTAPKPASARLSEPEATESKVSEPQPTGPEVIEAEISEPESTESEVTESEVPRSEIPRTTEEEAPRQQSAMTVPVETAVSEQTPAELEPTPGVPLTAVQLYASRMGIDAGLDWSSCELPRQPAQASAGEDADDTIHITADGAEALQEAQSAVFTGDVHLTYRDQTIYADELSYDRPTELLSSPGHILIQSPRLRVAGEKATYNPTTGQGELSNAEYRIPERQARGSASLAQGLGEQQARFENITFTTCPPGNSDFFLSAREMHIDQAAAIGTFKGAKLEFLGLPLFYVPTMTIPLDNQRKSGFLIPAAGYSSENGVDISAPYYLNLAPNYDATLVPRLVSKRGAMLGGEFRFLDDNHRGVLAGEILPNDRKYDGNSTRGAFHADTHSTLAPRLSGDVLVNYVSDDQYLEDLGGSLAVSSTRHLLSRARLDYHADNWDAFAELRHFETLDDTISKENRPYSQLPRIRLDMLDQQGPAGLSYSLLSEYVYFYREDSVKSHRIDIHPGVSLPVRNDWSYIEPMVTARYTGYQLSDEAPGQDSSPNRAIGTFSVDSGLFFDRPTNWFGRAITQTLEPRAYYLYVPYEDQSDLPIFDTGLLDFNFDNLFRLNRFNGADRVGDANHLTLALSSSVLSDDSGAELLRASIGQIFHFRDREVTLPGETVADDSSSAFLAQVSSKLARNWQLRAGIEVDPHHDDSNIRQGLAQATYHGDNDQLFNAAYRLREGVVEQTDVGVIWPVSTSTSLIGRWYYSLQEDKTLEAIAGIEYGRCCWKVRAVFRHYLDNDSVTYNNSAMLQIVLHGLGGVGHDIDNYLDRSIYGY